MGQTVQSEVAERGERNEDSNLDIERNRILSDTNRLSELEKYNIVNCGRLESVDLICVTANIAFEARFCGVALVDHADVHILGFAGSLANPREALRDTAIEAVCELSDDNGLVLKKLDSTHLSGAAEFMENMPKLLVLPLRSENGCKVGAFIVGIDDRHEITRNQQALARSFVAHCLQNLESQRMQSRFAQRAAISRRQAEKLQSQKWALIRNDKLFGKVSRMARIGGWELDTESRRVTWSGKVQGIFGLSADSDVNIKQLLKRLGRANLKQFRKLVEECQSDGAPFELEFVAQTFAGIDKWFRITGEAEFYDRDVSKVIGTVQDVSNQKEREAVIKHVATHDELTGLANRKLFNSEFERALNEAAQTGTSMTLLLIDADHFKLVNDTYGHNVGDAVLREFADRIQSCLRSQDLVARLGGDEFGAILPGISGQETLSQICGRLQSRLAAGMDHADGNIVVSASIGTATCPLDSQDAPDLLRKADIALYQSKENGRGRHSFFDESMDLQISHKRDVIKNILNAIDAGELIPYYQPIVNGFTGCISSLEALVRWQTPGGKVLPPAAFLEALEYPASSARIGETMINQVIEQITKWSGEQILTGPVAINLSSAELQKHCFAKNLISTLVGAGLHPSCITIEVTEGVFLTRGNTIIKDNLEELSAAGVRIALDDFGTGFASLTHLKEFPVDQVKIDRSFIMQIPQDTECLGIVKSIITLGRNLDLHIVAEGVETEKQADMLRNLGCDFLQGYLYSKPVHADAIPETLCSLETRWLEPVMPLKA